MAIYKIAWPYIQNSYSRSRDEWDGGSYCWVTVIAGTDKKDSQLLAIVGFSCHGQWTVDTLRKLFLVQFNYFGKLLIERDRL